MIETLASLGFGQPWWLLLLPLVPLAAWLHGRAGRAPAIQYSGLGTLRTISQFVRRNPGQWLRRLSLLALALCIVAMARPQRDLGRSPDRREGVDIVFSVDISSSMDRRDFVGNEGLITKREATILAISDFVDRRPNDRFGMVGFAEDTYILSPLTIDSEWIKGVLKEIQLKPWTAIGEGIETGVRLLKDSQAKSRIVIVASDGIHNHGIPPLEAAEAAARAGIRVYTVHFMNPSRVRAGNADSLMAQIAAKTGGMYFQAPNLDSIISIYREIDNLEKTKFEQDVSRIYDELYPWPTLAAFCLLLGCWIGGNTRWLRVP